jgi:hypothetical protein
MKTENIPSHRASDRIANVLSILPDFFHWWSLGAARLEFIHLFKREN